MAYTSEQLRDLQAAGERQGLFEDQKTPKVKRLQRRKVKPAKSQRKPEKRSTFESELERRDRVLRTFNLTPLRSADDVEPYDVSNATRYAAVKDFVTADGDKRLENILKQYHFVLGEQVIYPEGFRRWREQYMLMTPEQLGQLLRVSARTIRNWEAGNNEIPFSVWWMMHCTMQDPEYFLTRPGFHDFYIDYSCNPPELCSRTWRDIRYSPTDLWINRAALTEVLAKRNELKAKEEEVESLQAENTRLRHLLKAENVAAELQAMHAHIGDLLKRIHTADIIPFKRADEEAAQPKAAAAGC